ncbi:hypothetical protein [Couchioplanes caeruleus]|uniref:Uncharacterized protein n=2 Tax=Couchioplanes caeruleus TaxID=56438 RepID=A0A1K0GRW9_9ACTN|nr:hypothetical protein [Couchioplanes caeruleus]OJF15182.1 hypothetical protein BG844_05880 [Couchioplanes caeruleus subsp. caeruleus]
MIGAEGGSSSGVSRRSAAWWVVVVALAWVIFAVEQFFAYRVAGFGLAVLVLLGVGWVTATVVTVSGVVISWRRSRRFPAVTAAALGLLSAGLIGVVDWKGWYARDFYREHRQDFALLVDEVRQGLYYSDAAGGSQLSDELAHLSSNGLVGAVGTPDESVVFLPASAARGDAHRNGAGAVRGCAVGYLNVEVDMPPSVESYEACRGRISLGDGWYWAD